MEYLRIGELDNSFLEARTLVIHMITHGITSSPGIILMQLVKGFGIDSQILGFAFFGEGIPLFLLLVGGDCFLRSFLYLAEKGNV